MQERDRKGSRVAGAALCCGSVHLVCRARLRAVAAFWLAARSAWDVQLARAGVGGGIFRELEPGETWHGFFFPTKLGALSGFVGIMFY